jgi:hypothetical protein
MKTRLLFLFPLLFSFVVTATFQGNAFPISATAFSYSPEGTPTSPVQRLRMNLYEVKTNSKKTLIDGTLSEYAPNYSNNLDGMDARKLANYGLNISILRENTNIIIERRRCVESTDTISFKIWGTQKRTYQFEFIANSFDPRLECVLEDRYLHTKTSILFNDSTKVKFDVNNDAGSSDALRFRVIFNLRAGAALPITFTSLQAQNQLNFVQLSWQTQNEVNVAKYIVERSGDGHTFSAAGEVIARNAMSNSYQWLDRFPLPNNYYRVRGIEKDGNSRLSTIVRTKAASEQKITIFPNPATVNNLNLQMINQPAGRYYVKLINRSGQVLMMKAFSFDGFSANVPLKTPGAMQKGLYYLEVTLPSGEAQILNLLL